MSLAEGFREGGVGVVYVGAYDQGVRRTNIYLSEVQQVALDGVAVAEGRSRSEVLRAAIYRELHLDDNVIVDATLGDMAGELAEEARRFAAADRDLRIN